MTLQTIVQLITVISFLGGIAIFLFKSIVVKPLEKSINSLNETLKEFRLSTNKQLELHDKEIDLLKLKTTRHDEQLKTLFSKGSE